jgi:HD-GYP domain-containing protein (c-di-GMP phosphodiesterase class II)
MTRDQNNAADQVIRCLSTAVSTSALYGPEHRQVVNLCRKARRFLDDSFVQSAELSLIRVDDQLAIDNQPLTKSLYVDRFAKALKLKGIGHLKIIQSVTNEELCSLVAALGSRQDVISSTENVKLGQIEVRYRRQNSATNLGTTIKQAEDSSIIADVSCEELARIMEVYETISRRRKLHTAGLTEIVAKFIELFASYADPLLTLVPLRSMDEYTFTHSLNVCLLNLAQATSLGIDGALLHDIGLSAMLHDVGKLFVPEEILNKPDKLNDEEFKMIQQHPIKGAEYLIDSPGVPRMAVVNAYEHHMRYDLCGYPKVGKNWQQNICSQMTSISDVYDALRTKRPYRGSLDVETVLTTLASLSGDQLHPLLVDNFILLMKKAEPGEPKVEAASLQKTSPA